MLGLDDIVQSLESDKVTVRKKGRTSCEEWIRGHSSNLSLLSTTQTMALISAAMVHESHELKAAVVKQKLPEKDVVSFCRKLIRFCIKHGTIKSFSMRHQLLHSIEILEDSRYAVSYKNEHKALLIELLDAKVFHNIPFETNDPKCGMDRIFKYLRGSMKDSASAVDSKNLGLLKAVCCSPSRDSERLTPAQLLSPLCKWLDSLLSIDVANDTAQLTLVSTVAECCCGLLSFHSLSAAPVIAVEMQTLFQLSKRYALLSGKEGAVLPILCFLSSFIDSLLLEKPYCALCLPNTDWFHRYFTSFLDLICSENVKVGLFMCAKQICNRRNTIGRERYLQLWEESGRVLPAFKIFLDCFGVLYVCNDTEYSRDRSGEQSDDRATSIQSKRSKHVLAPDNRSRDYLLELFFREIITSSVSLAAKAASGSKASLELDFNLHVLLLVFQSKSSFCSILLARAYGKLQSLLFELFASILDVDNVAIIASMVRIMQNLHNRAVEKNAFSHNLLHLMRYKEEALKREMVILSGTTVLDDLVNFLVGCISADHLKECATLDLFWPLIERPNRSTGFAFVSAACKALICVPLRPASVQNAWREGGACHPLFEWLFAFAKSSSDNAVMYSCLPNENEWKTMRTLIQAVMTSLLQKLDMHRDVIEACAIPDDLSGLINFFHYPSAWLIENGHTLMVTTSINQVSFALPVVPPIKDRAICFEQLAPVLDTLAAISDMWRALIAKVSPLSELNDLARNILVIGLNLVTIRCEVCVCLANSLTGMLPQVQEELGQCFVDLLTFLRSKISLATPLKTFVLFLEQIALLLSDVQQRLPAGVELLLEGVQSRCRNLLASMISWCHGSSHSNDSSQEALLMRQRSLNKDDALNSFDDEFIRSETIDSISNDNKRSPIAPPDQQKYLLRIQVLCISIHRYKLSRHQDILKEQFLSKAPYFHHDAYLLMMEYCASSNCFEEFAFLVNNKPWQMEWNYLGLLKILLIVQSILLNPAFWECCRRMESSSVSMPETELLGVFLSLLFPVKDDNVMIDYITCCWKVRYARFVCVVHLIQSSSVDDLSEFKKEIQQVFIDALTDDHVDIRLIASEHIGLLLRLFSKVDAMYKSIRGKIMRLNAGNDGVSDGILSYDSYQVSFASLAIVNFVDAESLVKFSKLLEIVMEDLVLHLAGEGESPTSFSCAFKSNLLISFVDMLCRRLSFKDESCVFARFFLPRLLFAWMKRFSTKSVKHSFSLRAFPFEIMCAHVGFSRKQELYLPFLLHFRNEILRAMVRFDAQVRWKLICQYCADCDLPSTDENIAKIVLETCPAIIPTIITSDESDDWTDDAKQFLFRIINRQIAATTTHEYGTEVVLFVLKSMFFESMETSDAAPTQSSINDRLTKSSDQLVSMFDLSLMELLTSHCNLHQILGYLQWVVSLLSTPVKVSEMLFIASWLCESVHVCNVEGLASIYLRIVHCAICLFPECFSATAAALLTFGNRIAAHLMDGELISNVIVRLYAAESIMNQLLLAGLSDGRMHSIVSNHFSLKEDLLDRCRERKHEMDRLYNSTMRCLIDVIDQWGNLNQHHAFHAEVLPLSGSLWQAAPSDFRTLDAQHKVRWLQMHLANCCVAFLNYHSVGSDLLIVLHEYNNCIESHLDETKGSQLSPACINHLLDVHSLALQQKLTSVQVAIEKCFLSSVFTSTSSQVDCVDIFSRARYNKQKLFGNAFQRIYRFAFLDTSMHIPAIAALHKILGTNLSLFDDHPDPELLLTSVQKNALYSVPHASAYFMLNTAAAEDLDICNQVEYGPWHALAVMTKNRTGGDYQRWIGRLSYLLVTRFAVILSDDKVRAFLEAVQHLVLLSIDVAETATAICFDQLVKHSSAIGDCIRYLHDFFASILFPEEEILDDIHQLASKYFLRLFMFLQREAYKRNLAECHRKKIVFFPGTFLGFEYAAIATKACTTGLIAIALNLLELAMNSELLEDSAGDNQLRNSEIVITSPVQIDNGLLKRIFSNVDDIDAIESIPADDDHLLESMQQYTRGKYLESLLALENEISSAHNDRLYGNALEALGLNRVKIAPRTSNPSLSEWNLDSSSDFPRTEDEFIHNNSRSPYLVNLLSRNGSLNGDVIQKVSIAVQKSLRELNDLRLSERFKAMSELTSDLRQLAVYSMVLTGESNNAANGSVRTISHFLVTGDLQQSRVQFGLDTLLLRIKRSQLDVEEGLQQVSDLLSVVKCEHEAFLLVPLLQNFWKELTAAQGEIIENNVALPISYLVLQQKATLLWMKGSKDLAFSHLSTRVIAQLRDSMDKLRGKDQVAVKDRLADALSTAATWASKRGSSSPAQIVKNYFNDALAFAQSAKVKLRVHRTLADFCTGVYEHLVKRTHSPEWKDGERLIKDRESELKKCHDKKAAAKSAGTEEDQNLARHILLLKREIDIDKRDRDAVLQALEDNLVGAIRHYGQVLMSTSTLDDFDQSTFKVVGFWLNNAGKAPVNDEMKAIVKRVASFHFVPLHYQIFSRLGLSSHTLEAENAASSLVPSVSDRDCGEFQAILQQLIVRMCSDHPFHTLSQLLALINEKTVESTTFRSNSSTARCESAEKILQTLLASKKTFPTTSTMQSLLSKYIDLAKACTVAVQKQKIKMIHYKEIQSRGGRFHEILPELNEAPMLITYAPPISTMGDYSEILKVSEILPTFDITENGISRPKIICVRATNGKVYRELVKGGDDMRQDAVMQQVFQYINGALLQNAETRKRELSIRTYKVVPTSPQTGVLEWVENTEPFGAILTDGHKNTGLHSRYFPKDFKHRESRELMNKAADAEDKDAKFDMIEKNFHPAFRFFFVENFADPVPL